MKHITTITLTVSGLLIILFLAWRGMLPPITPTLEIRVEKIFEKNTLTPSMRESAKNIMQKLPQGKK